MTGPSTPGTPLPGQTTPGPSTPGSLQPDPGYDGAEVVEADGVAIDATGTTTLGAPDGFGGRVAEVVVVPDESDFDFNVEADGSDVFSAEQSPGGDAREAFSPDQNQDLDGDLPSLTLDVSGASGTGGATADVYVVVYVEEA
jgi:hypothetical protein